MQIPTKGFYRHYKQNLINDLNDYVDEMIGVVLHSENETYLVAYRPLYKNTYLTPADFYVRPLNMFTENVEKGGKTVPRFQFITDKKLIVELKKIKEEMYGKSTFS